MQCPGQDTRYWTFEDIFEIACPNCSLQVEFFKDDAVRNCDRCGTRVVNPKKAAGCAETCSFADQCKIERTK